MFGSVLKIWTKCLSAFIWHIEMSQKSLGCREPSTWPDHPGLAPSQAYQTNPPSQPFIHSVSRWKHPVDPSAETALQTFLCLFTHFLQEEASAPALLSAFIFGGGRLIVLLTGCFVDSLHLFFFSSAMKQKHPPFSSYLWLCQITLIGVLGKSLWI